jgi:catechol 2,3-dioxygenase-like lactoylglutathione lyase family enzyme
VVERLVCALPPALGSFPLNPGGGIVFDHLSLGVADLDRAVAFYDAALGPLGYVRLWRNARSAGYGPEGFVGEAPFAIIAWGADAKAPGPGFHLSFAAKSREGVDRFHAAALSLGGTDEGAPGIRENYDPGYYAAFVRDVDGHRLEAVLHERPAS